MVVTRISPAGPERFVRAKNISRSTLTVYTYVLLQHDHPSHALPFRLYLRWYDIPTVTCPCCDWKASSSDELSGGSSVAESVDTWFELYLAPDHGLQVDTSFSVSPTTCQLAPGEIIDWRVFLDAPEHDNAADATLLFRIVADDYCGDHWYRPPPLALPVGARMPERYVSLALSRDEVVVSICAFDLPANDQLRIRRRFHIMNTGNGYINLWARTSKPWSLVVVQVHEQDASIRKHKQSAACGVANCSCSTRDLEVQNSYCLDLQLPPDSSTELCVEVCVVTSSVWPRALIELEPYPPSTVTNNELVFYDADNILLSIPLILEIEFPVIQVNPTTINFDFVCNGDSRKSYFTVSHTSRTATLFLCVEWEGHTEFEVWPRRLCLMPGETCNIYVLYKAVYREAPPEGIVYIYRCGSTELYERFEEFMEDTSVDDIALRSVRSVRSARDVCGGDRGRSGTKMADVGARWCRAKVKVCAKPTHDFRCHEPPHDFTDDPHLIAHVP